jgi:hypothetical protein
MTTIFALLVLPLAGTAIAWWSRSARINYAITLVAGVAHLFASIYCLLISLSHPALKRWAVVRLAPWRVPTARGVFHL